MVTTISATAAATTPTYLLRPVLSIYILSLSLLMYTCVYVYILLYIYIIYKTAITHI